MADQLSIGVSTNSTFNRNYAARINGTFASDRWITNTISQTFSLNGGDVLNAVGFVWWRTNRNTSTQAAARLEAKFEGPLSTTTKVWTNPTPGWTYFNIYAGLDGMMNGGFEAGSVANWMKGSDSLSFSMSHTIVAEGEYALKMAGSWTNGWSMNHVSQGLVLSSGDVVQARARINIQKLQATAGWAVAGIKLENESTGFSVESAYHATTTTAGWVTMQIATTVTNSGYFVFRCFVAGDPTTNNTVTAEVYFDDVRAMKKPVAAENGNFEAGNLGGWFVGTDHLIATVSTARAAAGSYSLHMGGSWTGWSFNQAAQGYFFRSGAVVRAKGKIYLADLERSAGWAVAGLKLESADGKSGFEHVYNQNSPEGEWMDLAITAVISNTANYDLRCMVCGDVSGGSATGDVYFDEVEISQDGAPTGTAANAKLTLTYSAYSGGAGSNTEVDLYYDSVMLEGSSAGAQPASAIYDVLRSQAAATAANPDENDIPPVVYPKLNAYGYAGGVTNPVNYASSVELMVASWRFRRFTNDVVITITNAVRVAELGGAGPGWMELDQYQYCARNWNTERGAALILETNAPYFALGTRDNSSGEFGSGPFQETHTYVVGTSLTNLPRRLVTHYDGKWPKFLHIVFDENLKTYDRSFDKYFVLHTVPTSGPAQNVKAVKLALECSEAGNTNLAFLSQEIHMGWATDAETRGRVDYPNCTYQDHNEVFLRTGWKYGLLDRDDWFIQQVPRGSATIEPIDLFNRSYGSWGQKMYEEYLFSWPNAASGVKSIFENDTADYIAGQASYFVGYKIGHKYGTNEFGEPKFPGIIEIRGNGYFRITDFDGVMGGSFRPVSEDIFGIYKNKEDAPIIPAAYASLTVRSTPTNQSPDDSFTEIFMPVRSKTNQWFTGVLRFDGHFSPEEVASEGVYYDLTTDLYANRAMVQSEHGKLNAFAQVDMYWRGADDINTGVEGHDFDAVVVKKADGEWVTHQPINPPSNIYHRTLTSLRSNDVVYIMQQDRDSGSYGFNTEAPYRKVSSVEITMLDDGGRNLSLDMFEQNTISEINDNVVVACPINEDLEKGENVRVRYRCRSIYGPGVTLLSPSDQDGGEGWSNSHYRIELVATDGEDFALKANLFYGNGRDDDWSLINTSELLLVPTNTHRLVYDWNASAVPPGAYYIKAEVQRVEGGKIGFDVSNTRLQVGPTVGFPHNGATNMTVVTNAVGYLGTNMSFETGDVLGWASAADNLDIYATTIRAWEGAYSARMRGAGWTGWGWNNLQQQIPCRSGEVLRVQGRVFVGRLLKTSTNWVRCGIKMESTNDAGRTSTWVEFDHNSPTGLWANVDFNRMAPVNGTDRLLLWVGGTDCGGADVFFDDIRVTSTNTGVVVTNRIRSGYWEGDGPVNVSTHDVLSFNVSAAQPMLDLRLWVKDGARHTNTVFLTNYIDCVRSMPGAVHVPWSHLPTIQRTNVTAIGFVSSAGEPTVTAMKSALAPLTVSTRFLAPAATDLEGLPHYNAGQDVIEAITIRNNTAGALNGVTVQLLQEYAETTTWLDTSHHPELESEKTRRGDRLGGTFERFLTNVNLAAGASMTVTNVYSLPVGKLIDHTTFAIPSSDDWYIFRNYAARAQVHVVVRKSNGDNVFDTAQGGVYSMDDDFDIDNDKLPDYWETLHGGSATALRPDEDNDGDTYDNLSEFVGGSDPNDPFSYPGHVTSYTLHLAYTNGTDLFPRAIAEKSNYTGVACEWMIASYLNGTNFARTQTQIYGENATSSEHQGEITPQSAASWMYGNVVPGYYFVARSRTNLADALKESVYWMDYLPPGGKKTPVYVLCGTNWSYKVMRGFQTDRPPYDGGYGVTTGMTYTIYGVWLNDPRASGLGYDVYATASEMTNIYTPSEADGRRWLVAEPPQDPAAMQDAVEAIDSTSVTLAEPVADPSVGSYLQSLFGSSRESSGIQLMGDEPQPLPDLRNVLPDALLKDAGFMQLFDSVQQTNYYLVNPQDRGRSYVLAAGEVLGRASTVYVLKLTTNGAMDQATWSREPSIYFPMFLEAADWTARQQGGYGPAPTANLLSNGGFETNSGAGGTAAHWMSGAAAQTQPWGYRSGAWSLAVASWVANYAYAYQDYGGGVAGQPYTFAIWMSKEDGFVAGSVQLKLEFFNSTMLPVGQSMRDVRAELTNTYRLVRIDGTAPANTRTVRCTIWCDGVGGAGALKCDDAMLLTGTNRVLTADAWLEYDRTKDASPFLPNWTFRFSTPSGAATTRVVQTRDTGADSDGDGLSDRKEVYAGTDPFSAGSAFDCGTGAVNANGSQVSITWPSAANRLYTILRTTNVTASFGVLKRHEPATPPMNTYTDQLPGARAYYRVEVE